MNRSVQLILLIALITIINYFDRSAISYAIVPIEHDLGLNNAQFGLAAGAFGLGYLLISLFAGIIVDRYGSILVWGLSALVWSGVTMLIGFSMGFSSLASFLILLGIMEGFNSPCILRTISDWLNPKWRARAVSLALIGVPVASIIGGPLLSGLIAKFGWRAMFIILGCLGILWALLWFFFFRKKPTAIYGTPGRPTKTPWKELLSSPSYWANCFSYFTFGCIVFFVLMWLPGYLQQTYHTTIIGTGYLVVFPWLASALSLLAGGLVVDTIWSRTESIRASRVYPLCAGFLGAAVSFALLSLSNSLEMSLLYMSLGLAFAFFTNPAIYTLNSDFFPKNIATSQSLSTCFFSLAGIVSPSLTGWITHTTGSYEAAIIFIAILSLAASLIAFIFTRLIPKKQ